MTGRGAGYCAGYNGPGFANGAPPFRGGRGRGGGRGWRHRFFATGLPGWLRSTLGAGAYGGAPAPPDAQQELDALKAQAQQFGDTLERIRRRIDDIEGASTSGTA